MSVQTFSLTNGGTAQKMLSANVDCVSLIVQPITETSYINFGATAGVQAAGTITFAANATDTETIAVNGVTYTFKTTPSASTDVQIGSTKEDTATNLAAVLNASANAAIVLATYSVSGAVVTVTAVAGGTDGNAYTLADSSGGHATKSGATLSGGLNSLNGLELVKDTQYEFHDRSWITKDVYIVSATDAAKTVYLVGTGGRGLG